MGKRITFVVALIIAGIFICTGQPIVAFAGDPNTNVEMTPEMLIAEHVKSIGSPSLLASVNTRAFVGSAGVNFIQGMSGNITDGTSMFATDKEGKLGIVLRYNTRDYDQEYFSYDGKEVSVHHIAPGQKSPLADFLFRFNGIVKKGFFGGTLSLNWPLLDMPKDQDKLKFKKATIEGSELYELEWPMQTLGNIRIRMYFEPETFHHVRTDYAIRIREDVSVQQDSDIVGDMGTMDEEAGTSAYSSGIQRTGLVPDSIYNLTEKFSDFKKVRGMTLPQKYTIDYSLEGQGQSFIGNWDVTAKKWIFNQKLDEKLFKAQK